MFEREVSWHWIPDKHCLHAAPKRGSWLVRRAGRGGNPMSQGLPPSNRLCSTLAAGQCRRLEGRIPFRGPPLSLSAADGGYRCVRAFTGARSLETWHGKAYGSTASVPSCSLSQVKFQQSSFTF